MNEQQNEVPLIEGEVGRVDGVQITRGHTKLSAAELAALFAAGLAIAGPTPRRRTVSEWNKRNEQSIASAKAAIEAAEAKRARKAAKRLERGL